MRRCAGPGPESAAPPDESSAPSERSVCLRLLSLVRGGGVIPLSSAPHSHPPTEVSDTYWGVGGEGRGGDGGTTR